jgi:asparagine synthase (glutamine-hydrolysing)
MVARFDAQSSLERVGWSLMCGITGAVWTRPDKTVSLSELERMTAALRHRGPDDEGSYVSELRLRAPYEALPGVALGFRRLSIIDLAGGHQPMANEDGSVQVVCNGEIYNYQALQHRLEGSGHRLRTVSDTETIVHLYEDEGLDCFRHFNGMFAIAIWDAKHRRLVLARDRLGKKPLVYRHEPGRLLFASELKSLLQLADVTRDIDFGSVDAYLTYQYVPPPRTIFRGIHKLPPGHIAVWQDDRLSVRPFWQPDFSNERKVSVKQAAEELRETLTSAVKLRMRSDVPLGAFLSGGVDSSIIAALMQRESTTPIKTFTIGFAERDYDERAFARRVAQHIGSEHHDEEVHPQALEILPKLVQHFDEPFADSSAIPTWYLAEMTRRHVTVALSGDGGDELFLGYPRYRAVKLAATIDRISALRRILAARLWQAMPTSGQQKSRLRQFKRFSEALGMSPARRYLDWISIFNEPRRADLYSDEFVSQLPAADPFDFLQVAWRRAGRRDAMTTASLTDLTTYLPCDLLARLDIASMAHSLEARSPLLDHRVVEFAGSLPASLKYRFGRGKRLLQDAFGDLLPPEVFRRRKMGFGLPLNSWLCGELSPLVDELLSETAVIRRGWFRPEAVQRLVQEHRSRRFDHSARIWALLVLEKWCQTWCETTAASTATTTPLNSL